MLGSWIEVPKLEEYNPPHGYFVGNAAPVERLKIPALKLQARHHTLLESFFVRNGAGLTPS